MFFNFYTKNHFRIFIKLLIVFSVLFVIFIPKNDIKNSIINEENMQMERYFFPSEEMPHEGTWLIWPHQFTYGLKYRKEIEHIWMQITEVLHSGENIHIIAYDEKEQERISKLLTDKGLNINKIDFVIEKSDDVWARDTGPIFVFDDLGKLFIADFAFNGWGKKAPYNYDNKIPSIIAKEKSFPILSISDFVLEGGSIELDGNGTAMGCKSSIINKNRNPNMSIEQAENYIKQYFGISNFIWLDGVIGEDITDAHIDGIARFFNEDILLTVSKDDFFELYEEILESDYNTLHKAVNANGTPYKIIELPLTSKNVKGLDYKGNYINYYVGNNTVLVPIYNDANDNIAMNIIGGLYTNRKIVGIDVTSLYKYGGMLHCVTQQQPELIE